MDPLPPPDWSQGRAQTTWGRLSRPRETPNRQWGVALSTRRPGDLHPRQQHGRVPTGPPGQSPVPPRPCCAKRRLSQP